MEAFNNWNLYHKDEYNILKKLDFQNHSSKGYVYVLECGDKLKIGTTKEPYKRLKALKNIGENYSNFTTGSILVSKAHYNRVENEKLLHELFSRYRYSNGEMFIFPMEKAVKKILKTELTFEETDKRPNYSADDIIRYFRGDECHLPNEREKIRPIFVCWSEEFEHRMLGISIEFQIDKNEIMNKVEKYMYDFCDFQLYKDIYEEKIGVNNSLLIDVCEYFPRLRIMADDILDKLEKNMLKGIEENKKQ